MVKRIRKWDIKRGYSVYKSVYTPTIRKWIKDGRINEREVFVWSSGMSGWRRPEELNEFKHFFKKRKAKKKKIGGHKIKFEKKERPKILIIDDEVEIGYLLEKFLKKRRFEVFSASSGKSGINMVAEKEPDVVLLDLKLGDMDGINVLRKIRQFSDKIKVIIASAFADTSVKETALRIGADGFIDKPFKPEDIVKAIKRL